MPTLRQQMVRTTTSSKSFDYSRRFGAYFSFTGHYMEDTTSFDRLGEAVFIKMRPFLDHQMDQITMSKIQAAINTEFDHFRYMRRLVFAADGMQIVAAKAVSLAPQSTVVIRWIPAFFPAARYCKSCDDCTPLGFYGKYDLYAVKQTRLPPTLAARYGTKPDEYLSYNPVLCGSPRPLSICASGEFDATKPEPTDDLVFLEAWNRSKLINYDWHV